MSLTKRSFLHFDNFFTLNMGINLLFVFRWWFLVSGSKRGSNGSLLAARGSYDPLFLQQLVDGSDNAARLGYVPVRSLLCQISRRFKGHLWWSCLCEWLIEWSQFRSPEATCLPWWYPPQVPTLRPPNQRLPFQESLIWQENYSKDLELQQGIYTLVIYFNDCLIMIHDYSFL